MYFVMENRTQLHCPDDITNFAVARCNHKLLRNVNRHGDVVLTNNNAENIIQLLSHQFIYPLFFFSYYVSFIFIIIYYFRFIIY